MKSTPKGSVANGRRFEESSEEGSKTGQSWVSCTPKKAVLIMDSDDASGSGVSSLCTVNLAQPTIHVKPNAIDLFIWGFTSLSTLYRSYHDG